jgi:hypothetical protein
MLRHPKPVYGYADSQPTNQFPEDIMPFGFGKKEYRTGSTDRIKELFRKHGSLTKATAKNYGFDGILPSFISVLRKQGWKIKTTHTAKGDVQYIWLDFKR